MFGPYGPNMLESQSNFLHLIIIIIIFLSPRLQRQFTSNLLQTSAQWSLGIHLPEKTFFSFVPPVDLDPDPDCVDPLYGLPLTIFAKAISHSVYE